MIDKYAIEVKVEKFLAENRRSLFKPVDLFRQDARDQAYACSGESASLVRGFLEDMYPGVDQVLAKLAEFYKAKGDAGLCLPVYLALLDHRRRHLGLNFPHVGHCLQDMAELYEAMGDSVKARELKDEGGRIISNAKVDPELKRWIFRFGKIVILTPEYGLKVQKARELVELRRRELGPSHPAVAYALLELAGFESEGNGEELRREAQSIIHAAQSNPGFADVAARLANEADCRDRELLVTDLTTIIVKAKLKQAEDLSAGLQKIVDDSALMFNAMTLAEQGRTAEACAMVKEYANRLVSTMGRTGPELDKALSDTAQIYEAMRMKELAAVVEDCRRLLQTGDPVRNQPQEPQRTADNCNVQVPRQESGTATTQPRKRWWEFWKEA